LLALYALNPFAPHLTEEAGHPLLEAARFKSKRDVERLVAALHPQPDIASSVRALPVRHEVSSTGLADRPTVDEQRSMVLPCDPATGACESARTPATEMAALVNSSVAGRQPTVITTPASADEPMKSCRGSVSDRIHNSTRMVMCLAKNIVARAELGCESPWR
jgi:hypothetical protein